LFSIVYHGTSFHIIVTLYDKDTDHQANMTSQKCDDRVKILQHFGLS